MLEEPEWLAKSNFDKKQYDRERKARKKKERIDWALQILGNKCTHCGAVDDLEFDHIDSSTKLYVIRRNAWCRGWPDFATEVLKCQLLCHPCHRIKSSSSGDLKYMHRTHCKKGHQYTLENTGWRTDRSGHNQGQRYCKQCKKDGMRACYERRRDIVGDD